jgi:hypothetical protein
MIDWNDWNIEEDEDENILTDKKFVKFLEDNNAYDSFIYNLKHYGIEHYKIETFCNDLKPFNYISDSFTWSKTKEQFFWYELNKKWQRIKIILK